MKIHNQFFYSFLAPARSVTANKNNDFERINVVRSELEREKESGEEIIIIMAQTSSAAAIIPESAAENVTDGKKRLRDNGKQPDNEICSSGIDSYEKSNSNAAGNQNENTMNHYDSAEGGRSKELDAKAERQEQENEESMLEESLDSLPPPPPTTPKPPRQAQQDEGEGDQDGESELDSLPPYNEYSPAKSPGQSSVVRTLSFESSSVVSNGSSIGSASASGGVPGRMGRVGRAGRMGIMFGFAGKPPRHHDRSESAKGSVVNGVGGGSSAGSTHGSGTGNGTGILTRFLGMKKSFTGSFARNPLEGNSCTSVSSGVGDVHEDNGANIVSRQMTVENGPGKRMDYNHEDNLVGDDESTHIHDNLNHDMKEEKEDLRQQCQHADWLDSTPATVASSSVDSKSDDHDSDGNHQSIAAIQTPIFSSFQARDNVKGKEHNPVTTPLQIDIGITNCDEKNLDKNENDDGDRDAFMKKGRNSVLSSTPLADDEDTAPSSAPIVSQPVSTFTESAHESAPAIASKLRKGEEVSIPPTSSSNNEESSLPSHPPTPMLAQTQQEEPSQNPSETFIIKGSHTDTIMQSKKSTDGCSTRDHGSSHIRNKGNSNNTEGSNSQHHDGIFSRLFCKSSARKLSSSMEEAGSDADANADADLSSVVNGSTAEAHFSATAETTLAMENSTSASLNEAKNGSSNALKQLSYKDGADSRSEEGDLLVSFYGVVKPSLSTNDSDQASETNSWDDLLVDFADLTKQTNESKPLGEEESEKKEESKAGSNEVESKHEELPSSPEEVDPTPTEDHTARMVVAAVSGTLKIPPGGPGADTSAAEDDDMLVSFYSKDEAEDLLVRFYGVVKPSSPLGEVEQNNPSMKSQLNAGGRLTNSSEDDKKKILDDETDSLCMPTDALENDANTSLKSNCSDTSNDDEPGDVSISTDNFLPEIISVADSNSRLGSPTFSIDTAETESSLSPKSKEVDQTSDTFDQMPSDMKVILTDEITGITIEEFFNIAWSEGTPSSPPSYNDYAVPPLYGPWLTSCGKNNVSIQQWAKVDAGNEHIDSFTHRRGVEFDFEKSTLGIHSKVKVHHEQKYQLTNYQLILHMTILMKGFPYAECFRVEVRHLVNKRRTDEIDLLDIEVGLKVVFLKSTIIERKIRNNTSEETVKSQSDLLQTIKKACLDEVKRKTFDKKSFDSSSGDAPIETSAEAMTAMMITNTASVQVESQPIDKGVVGDASEINSEDIPINVTAESNRDISSREGYVEVKRQTASHKCLSECDVTTFETGQYCFGVEADHAIGNESANKQNSVEFKDESVDLIGKHYELEHSVDKVGKVGNSYKKIASRTEKTETTILQGALAELDTKRGEEAANNVEEASMQQVGSILADTTGGKEAVEIAPVYATRDSDSKLCSKEDSEVEVHVNDSVEAAKECDAESSSKDEDLLALVIRSSSISNESLSIPISALQDQGFNMIDSSMVATNMCKKKEIAFDKIANKQCTTLSGLAQQYHSMPATTTSVDEMLESNRQCRCFWCPDLLSNLFRGSKPKAVFVSQTPASNFDINNMQGSVDDFREELLALMNRGGISPTKRDRILQEVLVIQQSLDRISSISMNNLDENVNVQVDDV